MEGDLSHPSHQHNQLLEPAAAHRAERERRKEGREERKMRVETCYSSLQGREEGREKKKEGKG